MLQSGEVNAMKTLWEKGWRVKEIARELGHGKNTVKRYVRAFLKGLDGLERSATPPGKPPALSSVPPEWLRERLVRHAGNADVVRQDLERELGIRTSLRTVERAVAGFRQDIRAEALATIRFETPPGRQLQVDFGTKWVEIAGVRTKVRLCVLTLGYSRRIYVQAFRTERQADWFAAIEGAIRHFGGATAEILVDNAKALVDHNDGDGNVTFNPGFKAFCEHWGMTPRACRPYRARTKGKDERAVQYVKRNALAGRTFASWDELEAHLMWWIREIADVRIHQTTKEAPIARFEREKPALIPAAGHRPYLGAQSWRRVVKADATVDVWGNAYSVPYRLIGKTVVASAEDGRIVVRTERGDVVAQHVAAPARSGARVIAPEHLKGVMRLWGATPQANASTPADGATARAVVGDSVLLRPLSEYEALFDGAAALQAVGGAP